MRSALTVVSSLAFAFAVLGPATEATAADGASADEVKARFLYQLLRYVTWGDSSLADAEGAYVIGISGDDKFAATVKRVTAAKTVQGLPIRVETIATLDEDPPVHLLFFSGTKRRALKEKARPLRKVPVLTVAELFEFPKFGGDIGIEMVGGRVSFSVNRQKTGGVGIDISSKLLRLASGVR